MTLQKQGVTIASTGSLTLGLGAVHGLSHSRCIACLLASFGQLRLVSKPVRAVPILETGAYSFAATPTTINKTTEML